MSYIKDRMDYYVDQLKARNFYVARSQDTPESQTRYMINASNWRRAVIFTSRPDSCFRIDFLVVESDDSIHMSEEQFVEHLKSSK
jgi:predicted dithiol-disulfide oxidoreductase (DUF899 family)